MPSSPFPSVDDIKPSRDRYLATLAPYYGVNLGERELRFISAFTNGAIAFILFEPAADIASNRVDFSSVLTRPSSKFIQCSIKSTDGAAITRPVALLVIHKIDIMPFRGTQAAQYDDPKPYQHKYAQYTSENHMARVSITGPKAQLDLIPVALLTKLYGNNWLHKITRLSADVISASSARWMPWLQQYWTRENLMKQRIRESTSSMSSRTPADRKKIDKVIDEVRQAISTVLPIPLPICVVDPIGSLGSLLSPMADTTMLPQHRIMLSSELCKKLIGAGPHHFDTPTEAMAARLNQMAETIKCEALYRTPLVSSGDFDIEKREGWDLDEPKTYKFDRPQYMNDAARRIIPRRLNELDNDTEMAKYWKVQQ